ncbi:MAG: hypothetical protein ACTS4V_01120 [Candidatus Hodgkinia cicadicola]
MMDHEPQLAPNVNSILAAFRGKKGCGSFLRRTKQFHPVVNLLKPVPSIRRMGYVPVSINFRAKH